MMRAGLVLTAALFLSACSKAAVEEVATTAATPVTVITVAPATLEGIVSATGVVTAAPGADLTVVAPEPARIIELPKAEGDRVKPGDLLVRFEIPSLSTDVSTRRAEVQQAQARVENAQASVTRLTTLVEHGVAAQKHAPRKRRRRARARTPACSRRGRWSARALPALWRGARTILATWSRPAPRMSSFASSIRPAFRSWPPWRFPI